MKKEKHKENRRSLIPFLDQLDLINYKHTIFLSDRKSSFDKKEDNSFQNITNYEDFSFHFNKLNTSLKEQYKEYLDDNPINIDIDIPSLNDSENVLKIPYGEVINYIIKIKYYHVPLDKMTIIALATILITDCIKEFWKGYEEDDIDLNINADDLMTIYLYIVYNMDLSSIYTQLDFIKYFIGEKTKNTMIGYHYVTLEGCLNVISSASSKEDFTKINNDI